jgi:hypothetical protein
MTSLLLSTTSPLSTPVSAMVSAMHSMSAVSPEEARSIGQRVSAEVPTLKNYNLQRVRLLSICPDLPIHLIHGADDGPRAPPPIPSTVFHPLPLYNPQYPHHHVFPRPTQLLGWFFLRLRIPTLAIPVFLRPESAQPQPFLGFRRFTSSRRPMPRDIIRSLWSSDASI